MGFGRVPFVDNQQGFPRNEKIPNPQQNIEASYRVDEHRDFPRQKKTREVAVDFQLDFSLNNFLDKLVAFLGKKKQIARLQILVQQNLRNVLEVNKGLVYLVNRSEDLGHHVEPLVVLELLVVLKEEQKEQQLLFSVCLFVLVIHHLAADLIERPVHVLLDLQVGALLQDFLYCFLNFEIP